MSFLALFLPHLLVFAGDNFESSPILTIQNQTESELIYQNVNSSDPIVILPNQAKDFSYSVDKESDSYVKTDVQENDGYKFSNNLPGSLKFISDSGKTCEFIVEGYKHYTWMKEDQYEKDSAIYNQYRDWIDGGPMKPSHWGDWETRDGFYIYRFANVDNPHPMLSETIDQIIWSNINDTEKNVTVQVKNCNQNPADYFSIDNASAVDFKNLSISLQPSGNIDSFYKNGSKVFNGDFSAYATKTTQKLADVDKNTKLNISFKGNLKGASYILSVEYSPALKECISSFPNIISCTVKSDDKNHLTTVKITDTGLSNLNILTINNDTIGVLSSLHVDNQVSSNFSDTPSLKPGESETMLIEGKEGSFSFDSPYNFNNYNEVSGYISIFTSSIFCKLYDVYSKWHPFIYQCNVVKSDDKSFYAKILPSEKDIIVQIKESFLNPLKIISQEGVSDIFGNNFPLFEKFLTSLKTQFYKLPSKSFSLDLQSPITGKTYKFTIAINASGNMGCSYPGENKSKEEYKCQVNISEVNPGIYEIILPTAFPGDSEKRARE